MHSLITFNPVVKQQCEHYFFCDHKLVSKFELNVESHSIVFFLQNNVPFVEKFVVQIQNLLAGMNFSNGSNETQV